MGGRGGGGELGDRKERLRREGRPAQGVIQEPVAHGSLGDEVEIGPDGGGVDGGSDDAEGEEFIEGRDHGGAAHFVGPAPGEVFGALAGADEPVGTRGVNDGGEMAAGESRARQSLQATQQGVGLRGPERRGGDGELMLQRAQRAQVGKEGRLGVVAPPGLGTAWLGAVILLKLDAVAFPGAIETHGNALNGGEMRGAEAFVAFAGDAQQQEQSFDGDAPGFAGVQHGDVVGEVNVGGGWGGGSHGLEVM